MERTEHTCRLSVSSNKVRSNIFGAKGDKVTTGWRRLYNEALPDIIRMLPLRRRRWAGHVARIEEISSYKVLVENHEENRPLGIHRRRWEDNIKIGLKEVGWGTWSD
jgi:hypothetical protein